MNEKSRWISNLIIAAIVNLYIEKKNIFFNTVKNTVNF